MYLPFSYTNIILFTAHAFNAKIFPIKEASLLGKTSKIKTLIGKDDMFRYNLDTVLLCLGLFAVGISLNKLALYQGIACLLSGIISEYIGFSLILKKKSFSDLSVFASSLLIALLLPASAPLYVGILASAFAVFVAKLPFGDSRNAPFVPAAAGFCFVAMLFPEETFTYAAEGSALLFSSQEGFIRGTTLLDMLSQGNSIRLNTFGIAALLSGNIPGAMGTTSILALLGVFGYRLIRDPKRLTVSAGFILSSAVFVCLFPRLHTDILTCMILELCAGSLIFTALMLINDPVSSPAKPLRGLLYGALAGIISMALRYFGNIYDGSVFAVLIMNCLWPALFGETASTKLMPKERKKKAPKEKKPKKLKEKSEAKGYQPTYDLFDEKALSGGQKDE